MFHFLKISRHFRNFNFTPAVSWEVVTIQRTPIMKAVSTRVLYLQIIFTFLSLQEDFMEPMNGDVTGGFSVRSSEQVLFCFFFFSLQMH